MHVGYIYIYRYIGALKNSYGPCEFDEEVAYLVCTSAFSIYFLFVEERPRS